MKRSVRKRADRVIMKGVEVMYKKKNSAEVRMIQSREEQIWVLEVRHSAPTSWHFGVKKTFNRVKYVEVLLERDVQRCRKTGLFTFISNAFSAWFECLLPFLIS